jgi:uncharacterized membrane protein YgcG
MFSIPQILPWARAGLALAGLAGGVGACAPVPYASYAAPDCRPFQQLVTVNGRQQTQYTTQCRMADGTWHVVAQSDGTSSAPVQQPQGGTPTPLASNPQNYAYTPMPYDPGFNFATAGYPYPYVYPYAYPYYPWYGSNVTFGVGFGGWGRYGYGGYGYRGYGYRGGWGHGGWGGHGGGGWGGHGGGGWGGHGGGGGGGHH